MTAKTAAMFNMEPGNLLAAGAVGAGVGVGGRTLKNLWDMWKDRDVQSAVANKMPKDISNRAQIPVTVSPEEAQELEASGVHVKAAGEQMYCSRCKEPVKNNTCLCGGIAKAAADLNFLDKFALGAAGTGAAALGWKALDGVYDKQRLALATTKRDNARKRVQALLSGSFQPQDAALGTAMKVAEDKMIKEAWTPASEMLGNAVNSGLGQLGPLGFLAGGGAALVAASAFNSARKRNKSLNNSKAMAEYARSQPTKPPIAELVPVMGKMKSAAELKTLGEELKGRLHGRPA